jgi:hypothetical protein
LIEMDLQRNREIGGGEVGARARGEDPEEWVDAGVVMGAARWSSSTVVLQQREMIWV